jgi:hypothetical protein
MTRYAHMRAAVVEVGDRVARGDQIGFVGSSGITTGPHLHYEVLVNGKQVDPLRYRLPQPSADTLAKAAPAVGTPTAATSTAPPAPAPTAVQPFVPSAVQSSAPAAAPR